ncbi:MAG TPA: HAMP domain-containing histidine kinase [Oceanithermus profundus]|uniref:histidine kinase n=1 Tax=Oceanithermus profundus TaxID=187137 RepID=A0A7C4Z415_9DEIN|nr:HAMP domain-containing histidine kinase [Oceanithermus profundus]
MTLRLRIALGTATIAAVAAGLYLFIGYLSFSKVLGEDVQRNLQVWSSAIAGSLNIENGRPVLTGTDWSWLSGGVSVGFRVRRGRTIFAEGGVLPSAGGRDWVWTRRPLQDGFELELAAYVGEYRRALTSQLWVGLVTLPLVVALASALGWLLAGRIVRPVDQLASAADQLSQMQFPDPVPPPPGDDELTRLARSFNRMVFAVRDALERERAFTRYASHELRTPLATMQAQLEALEAGLTPQEKALPETRKAIERMRGILEGLLTLSREPQVTLEPLPAGALLRSLVTGLGEAAERVRLELPDEEVWVVGDEELLSRALGNLIDNALKYSEGPVEVRLAAEGDEAVLSVRDHGDGVTEDQIGRLADPFVRFHTRVAGTGLGLSLSKQAVQAMHGHLGFEPARPGLRAWLRLPLEDADA